MRKKMELEAAAQQAVAAYLAALGRKGGQAGTGKVKRRSAAHYRDSLAKARASRARNTAQREAARPTAEEHRAADISSGGTWQCACAACTVVRAWEEKRARQAEMVAAKMAKARAARKPREKRENM